MAGSIVTLHVLPDYCRVQLCSCCYCSSYDVKHTVLSVVVVPSPPSARCCCPSQQDDKDGNRCPPPNPPTCQTNSIANCVVYLLWCPPPPGCHLSRVCVTSRGTPLPVLPADCAPQHGAGGDVSHTQPGV